MNDLDRALHTFRYEDPRRTEASERRPDQRFDRLAFALTAVVFLTFTVGYRTRLFHLLSLLCITSLNARNLLVENGGTVVMNLLCFWTAFLPLGRRVSIDALLASLAAHQEQSTSDLNLRHHQPEGGASSGAT